jgi:hypothetical protein
MEEIENNKRYYFINETHAGIVLKLLIIVFIVMMILLVQNVNMVIHLFLKKII